MINLEWGYGIVMGEEQGTALLEFCLVLPLLFVFVWGVLAFSLYVIESQMLHFSAYLAARTALTNGAEAGKQAAAGFLVGSRKELFWLSETTRKLAGSELTVNKGRNRVDVEIVREKPWWSAFLSMVRRNPWDEKELDGLDQAFNRLHVRYAIGRSQ